MPFDDTAEPEVHRRRLALTRRFAAAMLNGQDFEDQFLALRMEAAPRPSEPLEDVLTDIFYEVDEFVSDEQVESGGFEREGDEIDEDELRRRVTLQLARLDGAANGVTPT